MCPSHGQLYIWKIGERIERNRWSRSDIATDFHFFFKYSSSRREHFQNVSNVAGVLTQRLEKHCFSRWISLDKVFGKLIEQFPNLMEYFFKTLPQLPGFNGKSSMARYTRINRTDHTYLIEVLILINVVASVAQDFQKFLKPLKDVLVEAAAYLVNALPMKVQAVFYAKFLHPKKQQARSTSGAISILTRSIVSSLPEETIKKKLKITSSHVDVVVEVVSSEFRKYQLEIISESF